MAPSTWTTRALRALLEQSIAKALAAALLAIICSPLLVTGAQGPGLSGPAPRTLPGASITRSGDEVIITGSIGNLFETGSFAGPNRAEKTNRARIVPDVMQFASVFDAGRTQLASLRGLSAGTSQAEDGPARPPVALASIHPDILNPALTAIDAITGDTPFPMTMPGALAYARADMPATDFAAVTDKKGNKIADKDVWCLATAIYFEARGETYRGQVAVGQVVMNRLAHRLYPKTICGVVFQNQNMRNACQFSFACDGIPETITDKTAWAQANEIAKGVLNGSLYLTEVANATHYHATYVYPYWASRLKRVTKIGLHVFYRFKKA